MSAPPMSGEIMPCPPTWSAEDTLPERRGGPDPPTMVVALGSPSDDGAITRFFDPIYPSSALSRGLPDDLLREDGDDPARSRESSVDQVDVFVDALDRRVGRAFLQLETLFMPTDESVSSRAAIAGRARF